MMEEQYSVEEILSAVRELQNFNDKKKSLDFKNDKIVKKKDTNIPQDTLKLIEEAEAVVKSKMQSE
tara:strand:- start:187 stop:384 length:198 start_codon:yes stop_codon:yes gene_type:complete